MFCIHVDDFAVAAADPSLIDTLCTALREKYIVKERVTLEDFLGVHMEQELFLSQPGLISEVIAIASLKEDTRVVASYASPCVLIGPTMSRTKR